MTELEGQRIAVVGASRGLGRGVALALADAGASVLALARSAPGLAGLDAANVKARAADAADPASVAHLHEDDPPDAVVLVAGARPALGPLGSYEWEAFLRPFEVDAKATFHWLKAALRHAPTPSRVVVFSSGAALHGSPLSGGYAPAKQAQRFLCQYARLEAQERGLDLRIQCILPQLNPNTGLGRAGVRAYASRAGETEEEFVRKRFGETPLGPAAAGAALVELLGSPVHDGAAELMLTGDGLRAIA